MIIIPYIQSTLPYLRLATDRKKYRPTNSIPTLLDCNRCQIQIDARRFD